MINNKVSVPDFKNFHFFHKNNVKPNINFEGGLMKGVSWYMTYSVVSWISNVYNVLILETVK